jgi:2-iminobutanoate/2-iminopropanoate deaminase
MKNLCVSLAVLLLGASAAASAQPPAGGVPEGAPLRQTVLAGDTLYVSGQLDLDAQGNPGKTPQESAKLALEHVKKAVEDAGFKMNDLVLVQVFAADLKNFDAFNKVYRSYFTGPMPARAFIGAGALLRGGRFEVLGIAMKGHK